MTSEQRESLILDAWELAGPVAHVLTRNTRGVIEKGDLMAEGIVRIISEIDQFDPSRGEWRSWAKYRLRAGMIDALRDWTKHRSQDRITFQSLEDMERQPWSSARLPDVSAITAWQSLDRLRPRHRRVIEAKYLDDMDQREIATELGVNETRISQIHKKALAVLRSPVAA